MNQWGEEREDDDDEIDGRFIEAVNEYASTCDLCGELTYCNTKMKCRCKHDESQHGEKYVLHADPPQTVYKGCLVPKCICIQYIETARIVKAADRKNVESHASNRAKISDEERRFAKWQVKTLLRMAHEICERYGIQE